MDAYDVAYMKGILGFLALLYGLNYMLGYFSVHGDSARACERLLSQANDHPVAAVLLFPGEANACLDGRK